MSPYIHRSHDKFEGATITYTDTTRYAFDKVYLSHRSTPNGDSIYLHLEYVVTCGTVYGQAKKPGLLLGNLILLLNGTKRYSLQPQMRKDAEYFEDIAYSSWHEYMDYELTQDMLLNMAYAKKIGIKVSGSTTSSVLKKSGTDYDKEEISLSVLAKSLYNAIFDKSLFVEEIQNEVQRIETAKQQRLQKARAEEPFKEEIAKLIKQCNSHLGSVGCFLDHGVWVSDNEEKIINRFKGWGHDSDYVELHNHFAYAIPLFEALLKHLHEYNSTNENNMKVTIYYSTFTEEKLRDFINLLKSTKKKLYPIVIKRKMVIIAGTGYPLAVIAGGIWSIINSSWTPVISLFILVSVVLIIMAIVRKN